MNILYRYQNQNLDTIENMRRDIIAKIMKTQPNCNSSNMIPLQSSRNVISRNSVKREEITPFQTQYSQLSIHNKPFVRSEIKHSHTTSFSKIRQEKHNRNSNQRQVQTTIVENRHSKTMPLIINPTTDMSTIADRFHKIKFLGKGKYSDVFMAVDKLTNCVFAIKLVQKSVIRQYNLTTLLTQEIKVLSCINHPNVMKFYGVVSDKKEIALVLECCESSIYKYYEKINLLTEDKKLIMIYEILKGFSYLHDQRIIHRDVKPENIMTIQNHIKIGDFGLAMQLLPKKKLKQICGTPQYMAPEVAAGQVYDLKADCFSIGMIIEELKCKSLEVKNMVHLLKQNDQNLRACIKDFLQLKVFLKVKQILSQTTIK